MKKSLWCAAFLMITAGVALGISAGYYKGNLEKAEETYGILTPAWEEDGEQDSSCEMAQIADEEVPLAAGPGMAGSDTGIITEYAQPVVQESPYIRQVVSLVNEERMKAGLAPLEKSDDVTSAAAVRAKELTSSFSHTRPDGSAYRTVLEQSGISFRSCGENVAYGYRTPEAVMSAWMTSEGHRANILNEGYTDIGVGYFTDGGRGYWVQVFTMKK